MRGVRWLFFGVGVVFVALSGLSLAPYVETWLYSFRIPTAPTLSVAPVATSTPDSTAVVTNKVDVGGRGTPDSDVVEDPLNLEPSLPTETPQGERKLVPPGPRFTPVPTPAFKGSVPVALSIPSIDLQAPIVSIGWNTQVVDDTSLAIWAVPDQRAVGWHRDSALLGVPGNTVLNGHNTSHGEVFRDLYRVEVGDLIFVQGAEGRTYVYRVVEKYILREAGQPLSVRLENARYIQETPDERLTLVTCHPYGSIANRLILIAFPVEMSDPERKGAS